MSSTKKVSFPHEMYERLSEKAMGERIRKAREATKMSQSELASVVGKTQTQISRLESGDLEPGVKFLTHLSYISGVPMAALCGEVCADWVNCLVWVCTGVIEDAVNKNPKLNYEQFRVLAVDNIRREIFLTKSVPKVQAMSCWDDKKVSVEHFVESTSDMMDVRVYSLSRSLFFEKHDGIHHTNKRGLMHYPERMFVPGIDKYLEAFFRKMDRGSKLPEGWRRFNGTGRLIDETKLPEDISALFSSE